VEFDTVFFAAFFNTTPTWQQKYIGHSAFGQQNDGFSLDMFSHIGHNIL